MIKKISTVTLKTLGALGLLVVLFATAFSAYADTRSVADRTTVRLLAPVVVPAPVTPPSLPAPKAPSGGITSSTSGSINTGGNTGGSVTTGDGHVDVTEVNVGPTNPAPQSVDVTTGGQVDEPAPQAPCSSDRRAPNACPVQSPTYTR